MLCTTYEFAQSMGCPTQSSDRYVLSQNPMDFLPNYNPWIPLSILCQVWIK